MHPFFDLPRPTVLGHRGAGGERPENTLPSFAAALEQGAHVIESDVQLTRDGVPILLHDAELDRTTDGRGRVCDQDWAELAGLDAGFRFRDAAGGFPWRGRGVGLLRLEEAFATFPDARFNLELKTADPRAARATLDLVTRFEREARTLLTAGEDDVMRVLRAALAEHDAHPALGACVGEIVAAVRSALGDGPMPPDVMALQLPASFLGKPLVTPELVAHAHAHAVAVHVWTINDRAESEALLATGVDGLVTDHPGRLRGWLEAALGGRPEGRPGAA